MMSKPVRYSVAFFFLTVSLEAQDSLVVQKPDTLRVINQTAFALGERLVYDVGYSFITAGEAVFSIPRIDTLNGRACYQVLFTVNSTPSFSWIYKVEDRYETMLDVKGIFPWRFSQRIREGKYSRDFSAEFDQYSLTAKTTEGIHPIPPYVHDIVSAFYYARTMDFSATRPGEKIYLKNFYKDTTYQLAIKFLGFQRIDVDAGTFDCFLVEPLIMEGGLFKSDGRIVIYLSNDERKIPVKVSTKVPVGSINVELREYYGLTGPLTSKVK